MRDAVEVYGLFVVSGMLTAFLLLLWLAGVAIVQRMRSQSARPGCFGDNAFGPAYAERDCGTCDLEKDCAAETERAAQYGKNPAWISISATLESTDLGDKPTQEFRDSPDSCCSSQHRLVSSEGASPWASYATVAYLNGWCGLTAYYGYDEIVIPWAEAWQYLAVHDKNHCQPKS